MSAQRPPPSDSSSGSKPKMKPKTRRSITTEKPLAVGPPPKVSATQAQTPEELLDEAELEQALNIRVKERDPDDPPGGRNRSNRRLGQLFRDPSPSAAAIKETIKRPLSGLFRRPGSRSGSRPASRSGGRRGDDDDEPSTANGHVIIDDSELEQLAKTTTTSGSSGRRGALKGEKARGMVMVDDAPETTMTTVDVATVSPLRRDGVSPDIPQLEDSFATGFGFGDGVAHAPSIAVNRVASFRELDSALMKHAAFSTLEDIDLSLLTRFLCPESEVKDEEVPWSWDYLYTSICTELREEWALDEGEEDEQYDAQAPVAQDDQRQRGIAA